MAQAAAETGFAAELEDLDNSDGQQSSDESGSSTELENPFNNNRSNLLYPRRKPAGPTGVNNIRITTADDSVGSAGDINDQLSSEDRR